MKKAETTTAPTFSNSDNKNTTNSLRTNNVSSIKNKILSELSTGQLDTAKQLNDKFCFNDSRKVISVLRSEGKIIKDIRQSDKTKLYWHEPDQMQTSIQFEEALK